MLDMLKNSIYGGSLYLGSVSYILVQLWPGHRISFVISRTLLKRGSLNRGFHCNHYVVCLFLEFYY